MFFQSTTPRAKSELVSRWGDFAGMVASIACAIHCAAMPFVITLLPSAGLGFLADETFHRWMAVICFVLAFAAFLPGFRKHRRLLPVSMGVVGLSLIFGAAFGLEGECCPTCEALAEMEQPIVETSMAGNSPGKSSDDACCPACSEDAAKESNLVAVSRAVSRAGAVAAMEQSTDRAKDTSVAADGCEDSCCPGCAKDAAETEANVYTVSATDRRQDTTSSEAGPKAGSSAATCEDECCPDCSSEGADAEPSLDVVAMVDGSSQTEASTETCEDACCPGCEADLHDAIALGRAADGDSGVPVVQAGFFGSNALLLTVAPWLTPIGGLILVCAHLLNRRFGFVCGCCESTPSAEA